MHPPATIGDVAVQVLKQNAQAFEEHMPGAREGKDPRHVHQMRVATRRLRAALRLFADLLPPESASLNDELNWIAGQLSAARDLDVQLQRLRENGVELGLLATLEPYGSWLEEQRQRAQAELTSAIESPRFDHLLLHLKGLDAWSPIPATDAPLLEEAPRRLRRTFKKLRERARAIDEDSPSTELHKVRIAAKRLRYTAEFFESAYGRRARRLAECLTSLQDLLGELQDGVVGAQRIHQAVQTAAGAWAAETSVALGRVLQHDVQRASEIRAEFPQRCKAIKNEAWKPLRRSLD